VLRLGLRFDRPVPHPAAAGDQVDQRGQERDEDQEQHPGGLRPAGEFVVAEEVGEDRDQDPDPDHEEEDLEGEEKRVTQTEVGEEQSGVLSVRGKRGERHDAALTRSPR
jgi:hypothetical protein